MPHRPHSSLDNVKIVGTTEMFRGTPFFQAIREEVIPALAAINKPKIWHAGCSTGQEAYSMAILLEQAGLLSESRLYATDRIEERIEIARAGICSAIAWERYTQNYTALGLSGHLDAYVSRNPEGISMKASLGDRISFFLHDLVRDSSFQSFSCIFCRNVLIYYAPTLRRQILRCLDESLDEGGFLCLGRVEDLNRMPERKTFRQVLPNLPIYQKLTKQQGYE